MGGGMGWLGRVMGVAAPVRSAWRGWLIGGFGPIVLFALGMDSAWLAARWPHGQLVAGVAAPLYLLALLRGLRPAQRVSALLFVPFSAGGEYLFSLVFDWYAYRAGGVPFYIPFGHAILFSTGMLIEETAPVARHGRAARLSLGALHALLIGGAWLLLGDTLSAALGLIFAGIIALYRGRLLYLVMGVLVLYIELLGTALGCWRWDPAPFGLLRATNPPVGAFVCYVLADIIVIQLLVWARWMRASRLTRALVGRGAQADYARLRDLAYAVHDTRPPPEPAAEHDGFGRGYAVGSLGLTYAASGDFARALVCFERAAALARQRGDEPTALMAGWHQGRCLARRGDLALARPLMRAYADHLRAANGPDAARVAAQLAELEGQG